MKLFANWVLKYRAGIIVSTIIITLFMGYQLPKLTINSDILTYFSKDDPHVVLFNEVGDKFGGNSLALVALETEDVFNVNTLQRINTITQAFKQMSEISYVTSLTDVIDIKKIEGGLEIGKLIDQYSIPDDPEELRKIREYTLSKEMYRDNIVSEDATVTVIMARLKQGIDKNEVASQLKQIVFNTSGNEKIYFGGLPFQIISLAEMIQGDIILLIPLVVILLVITLAFAFRNLRGVLLPLGTVLISTVWALGIMALFHIQLSIASNVMPVLLLAIGSAYAIHTITKYQEDILQGDDKIQGIKDALIEVGLPIFLSGLTTMIGFLAFLTSNLTVIKQFGIFTGVGVFVALIISVTFLPAILSFMSTPTIKKRENKEHEAPVLTSLANFVYQRQKLLFVAGVILILAGLIAVPNLHREVNMVDYFKKSSEVRQAEDMMQTKLGGSLPIQILVKGDLKEPAVLNAMLKLEKYMQMLPDVNNPQSITYLICEMNDVMNDRYCIPSTREGVANLWFFIDGNAILPQLINADATEGLIQAKLGTFSTSRIIETVNSIDAYITRNMDSSLVSFEWVNLPTEQKEALNLSLMQEIIDRIYFDTRKYAQDFEINPQTQDVIRKYLAGNDSDYKDSYYEEILNKLMDYFSGDMADLYIDNPLLNRRVSSALVTGFRAEQGLSHNQVMKILKNNVPSDYYEDDPALLDYAAESVVVIFDQARQWHRVHLLKKELTPYLPEAALKNKDYTRKLTGNLWMINEASFSLPQNSLEPSQGAGLASSAEQIKMVSAQTGMPIIFKDLDENIVSSQIYSLIIAIGLVFILLSLQFKSARGGLISIVPIILTILFNFTLMVVFGIPLDIVTVMIGSVAVGIGIDYTIHFNTRFRMEIVRSGDQLSALQKTMQTTGKAILVNAVSVMMGFMVLILGSIVPMQRFGYMIALTMLTSAVFALTILPAIIMLSHAKFVLSLKHVASRMKFKNQGNQSLR